MNGKYGIPRSGRSSPLVTTDRARSSSRGFSLSRGAFLDGSILTFGGPGGGDIPDDWPQANTLLRVPKVVGLYFSLTSPTDLLPDIKERYHSIKEFFVYLAHCRSYPFADIPVSNVGVYSDPVTAFGTNFLSFYFIEGVSLKTIVIGRTDRLVRELDAQTGIPLGGGAGEWTPRPDFWLATGGPDPPVPYPDPDITTTTHNISPPINPANPPGTAFENTETTHWAIGAYSNPDDDAFYASCASNVYPNFPHFQALVYVDETASDAASAVEAICGVFKSSGVIYGGIVNSSELSASFFYDAIDHFFNF